MIIQEEYKAALRFAARMLGNREDAEDATQDVLFSAWLYNIIEECSDDAQRIENCLIQSMHNRLVDEYRNRRSVRERVAGYAAELLTRTNLFDGPYQFTVTRELRRLVARALEKLPPRCREAFILVRILDKPYGAVAEALQISVKTVEAHVAKACELLGRDLEAAGYRRGAKKEHRP